jgi:hypothetical protein
LGTVHAFPVTEKSAKKPKTETSFTWSWIAKRILKDVIRSIAFVPRPVLIAAYELPAVQSANPFRFMYWTYSVWNLPTASFLSKTSSQ